MDILNQEIGLTPIISMVLMVTITIGTLGYVSVMVSDLQSEGSSDNPDIMKDSDIQIIYTGCIDEGSSDRIYLTISSQTVLPDTTEVSATIRGAQTLYQTESTGWTVEENKEIQTLELDSSDFSSNLDLKKDTRYEIELYFGPIVKKTACTAERY